MTTHFTAPDQPASLSASAESAQDTALFNSLRHAHKNAGGLWLAYQAAVHGAATAANLSPTMAAVNALFLEQYARADAELTQQDLADRIVITREHLVLLETGQAPVTARLGRAIVAACRAARVGAAVTEQTMVVG